MLNRSQTLKRAIKAFTGADPDYVIFGVALRGKGYVEVVAPKPFDRYAFMSMAVPDE